MNHCKVLLLILLNIFILYSWMTVNRNHKENSKDQFSRQIMPECLDSLDVFVKNVPDSLVSVFQCVCDNFQELRNENIMLVFNAISTTMQARPTKLFGIRKYSITINSDREFEGIHFTDIPYDARIGVVAHEMSHILDYCNKSNFEVIKTGLQYLTKRGRRQYERYIDKLTIEKGFGKELKAWAQHAMYDSSAPYKYKDFKKYNYLNPDEIDSIYLRTN